MLLSSDGKTSLEFLSTPSARRATGKRWPQRQADCHFYPRPPRGGRRLENLVFLQPGGFLSTPSARRATRVPAMQELHHIAFLSTPSARRATLASRVSSMFFTISIHALREEGDPLIRWQTPTWAYFYPRPPRGGRRSERHVVVCDVDISIHALREEGDRCGRSESGRYRFLSTPSARRATVCRPSCNP